MQIQEQLNNSLKKADNLLDLLLDSTKLLAQARIKDRELICSDPKCNLKFKKTGQVGYNYSWKM